MHDSKHNTKVAIARWKRVHDAERAKFLLSDEGKLLRAALLGFLAGDGSVSKFSNGKRNSRYVVKFFPDDEVMLNTYLDFFTRAYAKSPDVKRKDEFFIVQITSKTICKDLLSIDELGTTTWRVPTHYLVTDEQKIWWLRAFFSAEAHVSKESITCQTVNEQGMQDISKLLGSLGIHHGVYAYEPAKPTHRTNHIIKIHRISARKKYFKLVGFWHQKKSRALRESLPLKQNF